MLYLELRVVYLQPPYLNQGIPFLLHIAQVARHLDQILQLVAKSYLVFVLVGHNHHLSSHPLQYRRGESYKLMIQ